MSLFRLLYYPFWRSYWPPVSAPLRRRSGLSAFTTPVAAGAEDPVIAGPGSIPSLPVRRMPRSHLATPAVSPTHACNHTAIVAAQRQGARCRGGTAAFSRARSCTTRLPAPGVPPAASAPHVIFTRRRCCPTARCSWQEEVAATASAFSRARNCTIRPPGSGPPPAASTPHAITHTATLLPNGKVLVAGGLDRSVNPSASAELYDPATVTWTATGNLVTAALSAHGDVAA